MSTPFAEGGRPGTEAAVSVSASMVYVCDTCGHIEGRDAVPEGGEWACENCASHAAWEFPPERRAEAENHAAHINRAYSSRLFHARHASEVGR